MWIRPARAGDRRRYGRRGRRRRGRGRRRGRRGRGVHADAPDGRGARARVEEIEDPNAAVIGGEDAARRIVKRRGGEVCGFVGQVKRRGGGLALARGRDDAAAARTALDHVVATGDLEVAGRHWRRCRRRRWRWGMLWRGWREWRMWGRGEHADALVGRGARARVEEIEDPNAAVGGEDAARRIVKRRGGEVCGFVGQVKRRGGGLALARGRDDAAAAEIGLSYGRKHRTPAARTALDHVVATGDLEVAGRHCGGDVGGGAGDGG